MGALTVVMVDVGSEDALELAASADQEPVEALLADRAHPALGYAFAFGARTGVLITLAPVGCVNAIALQIARFHWRAEFAHPTGSAMDPELRRIG